MSRGPIPSNKEIGFKKGWRQICAYSFPREALKNFTKQKIKTKLESIEDIEILRFIENGYKVKMIKMSNKSLAVDNKEDLAKAKIYLKYKKL
jgi:3-deoxy-manno-octulosonate cytidylyltransferase (CMP-KDO synthetase)